MKYNKPFYLHTFHIFSQNLGEKAHDSIEEKESILTFVTSSAKNLSYKARANYRMVVTFLFYLTLSYLLFALSIGIGLNTSYIGKDIQDQLTCIWGLYWWPYAISHHLNPLFTTFLWYPHGIDLSIAPASVPGASLIALPITLIFGPVASYNILIIVGNALSAFFTFLVTSHLTKSWKAGLISGLLFGFSTYQFVQMVHLNLALTFLIPLLCYIFIMFWENKIHGRVFILLVSSCLILQFLFSIEVFVTLSLVIGISFIIFLLICPEYYKKLLQFGIYLSVAFVFAILISSPFIYDALVHKIPTKPIYSAIQYSLDPLNFIIPTRATYFGSNAFAQLSSTFMGNFNENSGYLGLPAIVIILMYAIKNWNEKMARFLIFVLLSLMILSLGPTLHIAGFLTIPLPERFLEYFPVLKQLLPERLMVYSFFFASLIIGLWVGKNLTSLRMGKKDPTIFLKYLLIGLTLFFLFPNVRGGTPHSAINIPYYFSSGTYKKSIRIGDNVLFLPYSNYGDPILYQFSTNMYFNLAEGFVGPWELVPSAYAENPMTMKLLNLTKKPLTSNDSNDFKKYLRDFKIHELIIAQSDYHFLQPVLTKLNITPINVQGLLIYKFDNN